MHPLENYIRSDFYDAYPLTLYFQMQLECTLHCHWEKCHYMFIEEEAIVSEAVERLEAENRKYHDEPENK